MSQNVSTKVSCDIMISFNISDIEFVQNITEKFEEEGRAVWYADPKADHRKVESQKGEAILACKVFIIVMSEKSANDSQCKDELALAYISNSNIFPVGLSKFRDLNPLLDGGMRLMLAKINWSFFFSEELWKTNLPVLLASIKETITDHNEVDNYDAEAGVIQFHGMNINVNFVTDSGNNKYDSDDESSSSDEDDVATTKETNSAAPRALSASTRSVRSARQRPLRYDFWDRHFHNSQEVSWVNFKQKFESDYKDKIMDELHESKYKFLINIMYKDIFNLSKTIKRQYYDQFCEGNPDADPHRFYHRLQTYAVGYYAMREVFDMKSSLRLSTIQNLGSFSFPAVINSLGQMMSDEDPNIRAVATIAIAKSGKTKKYTVEKIISKLEDEDRLVRESACLALGYLKVGGKGEEAVADRWRNDPIKSVREAAELALKRMGGELAKRCVHVTGVLNSEMEALRQPSH